MSRSFRKAWVRVGAAFVTAVVGPAAFPAPGGSQELRLCSTVDYGLGLDHVAVAVPHLGDAGEAYRRLGFTLTPGDLQAAGHGFRVDLATYSDLEIVSSGDSASRREEERAGEEGSLLALVFPGTLDELVSAVQKAGVNPQVTEGPPAGYVSFPDSPDLSHILIFERHPHPEVSDSLMSHANGAVGIDKVWIQGTARTEDFLLSLSPLSCGVDHHPAGFQGKAVGLALGHIVVVRPNGNPDRFRVLGLTIRSRSDTLLAPEEARGIWLRLKRPRRSREEGLLGIPTIVLQR